MYFISSTVILLASLALIVQVSLPYNKTGRASLLYTFILVFLRVILWPVRAINIKTNEENVGNKLFHVNF